MPLARHHYNAVCMVNVGHDRNLSTTHAKEVAVETNPRAPRIGAVNYLNTKPLVHRLAELSPGAEIAFEVPSRLSDGLANGKYDVALIPSVEYFRRAADYVIVSDACIACRGPVLSVKLLFRRPPAEIRSLALDEGSRTSIALARILLSDRHGLSPRMVPFPLDVELSDVEADAILMIGDRAIHSPPGKYAEIWDLGDEWCRHMGLPFVFAMWVARRDAVLSEWEAPLRMSRDAGVAHLEQIAAREAAPHGLTRPQCLAYLRDNLHFYLGPEERRGLEQFYRRTCDLGLAPQGVSLDFHDCARVG